MTAKQSRQAISKKLRFEVFARDGYRCQYCGRTPPEVVLHLDHVLAVAKGGGNTEDNLITACRDCNAGKGTRSAKHPSGPSVAERTELIAESEEQLARYRKVLQKRAKRVMEDVSLLNQHFWDLSGEKLTFTDHGKRTVKVWLERWTVEQLKDAFDIASINVGTTPDFWPYVGGILRRWRESR